jgi:hypothetical protein
MGDIQLSHMNIDGHVIIQSDSLIEVDQTTTFSNVILIAPVIRIKRNVIGAFQAIASDSIIVEKNCTLLYPSALVLLKDKRVSSQNTITVMDSSVVNGVIFTLADSSDMEKSKVELGTQTIMNGVVYVQGYLSLKGKVNGSVLANYLLYQKTPSMFINYLVDAVINRNKLSPYYIGPEVFDNYKMRDLIQWVQ